MPRAHIVRRVPVLRSPRVIQLEGLFDLPPSQTSERAWDVDLPLGDRKWHIGLIVGPSGCGKSTIAREFFGEELLRSFRWSSNRSIVDDFPAGLGMKGITGLLSSVGFSSPPSWLRPYHALSTGEQFRVDIARALAESPDLAVIDEFTSVVDRTVAQIGSAAIAKTARRRGQKVIAATCHYDVIDWLQPDWIYQPATNQFDWRSVQQRPSIELEITRVHRSAWELFKHHHYLDRSLHRGATCFLATWGGRPVAFTAVLFFPHPRQPGWREHRTVCLPDFQGAGIGSALSAFVASLFKATGRPYRSTTSHPAMIASRARSPDWHMVRAPSRVGSTGSTAKIKNVYTDRISAGFRFVGRPRPQEASGFGLMTAQAGTR